MRWTETGLGEIVADHYRTLGAATTTFTILVPAGLAIGATQVVLADGLAAVLLAAVGVLTGFLFQVLAWIGGRIGELSDSSEPAEPNLLTRLRCARSNVSYATLSSLSLVLVLAGQVSVQNPPAVLTYLAIALLAHLFLNLLLVLTRVNAIGIDDERSTERNGRRHLGAVRDDGKIRRRREA